MGEPDPTSAAARKGRTGTPLPRGWLDLLHGKAGAGGRIDTSAPLVLLDDARSDGLFLFRDPMAVLQASQPGEIAPLLDAARRALADGHYVAGYLTYEARLAFNPARKPLHAAGAGSPLAWFGIFPAPRRVAATAFPTGKTHNTLDLRPCWTFDDYARAAEQALEFIRAGDVYQINLTFQNRLELTDPWGRYRLLRGAQRAGWGGLVHTGSDLFLSFSPELFFAIEPQGRIVARPMKGTARRHDDCRLDGAAAAALQKSVKDRAENLMIVDLLRNDIGRVARAGSVAVPRLFEVETYPTVHQLTSTITAMLSEGRDVFDLMAAAFPCGSVTGAPKMRAMEIISELESGPRGLYTGSIGFAGPDGTSGFNLAIRTIACKGTATEATMGLGSAVVADSQPMGEWSECLMKGAFLEGGFA
ncbi:aminodeoxychorismate synthase component I [Sphingobium sp. B2]|uniref:aminodeoxychorismate synthase component I n=1 Tax=Sphingobium sp. B2 TaxID=2583228 RepID=UPI0011A927AB|nr:aminodeoxychorismate synthase component I [Sphingobium sp. B2]